MLTRNLTLALPPDLIREIKVVAAERDTSISAIVAEVLGDLVRYRRGLAAARRRHRALVDRAANLGTRGRITWSRGDLHER